MSESENEKNNSTEEDEERYAALPAAKSRSKRAILLKQRRQRFCPKWENSFPWLRPDNVDESIGICTVCDKRLVCKKSHLERHQKTYKHQRSVGFEDVAMACDRHIDHRDGSPPTVLEFLECGKQEPTEETDEFEHAIEVDQEFITECEFPKSNSSKGENEPPLPETTSKSIPLAWKSIKFDRMKLLRSIERDRNELNEYYYSYRKRCSSSPAAKNTNSTQSRDAFDLFFDSVSASVKTLPPKLAAEVKIRVSQIVAEFELRAICERENIENPTNLVKIDSTSLASSATAPTSAGENQLTHKTTEADSEITTVPNIMYTFQTKPE